MCCKHFVSIDFILVVMCTYKAKPSLNPASRGVEQVMMEPTVCLVEQVMMEPTVRLVEQVMMEPTVRLGRSPLAALSRYIQH